MEQNALPEKGSTSANVVDGKLDSRSRQLELARESAVAQVNLIYDALSAIACASAKLTVAQVELDASGIAPTTCERIDVAVRDHLTDALDDISWMLSTFRRTSDELLGIQAKLLLHLLEDPNDTPVGALARSIAAAIAGDQAAGGQHKLFAGQTSFRGYSAPAVAAN